MSHDAIIEDIGGMVLRIRELEAENESLRASLIERGEELTACEAKCAELEATQPAAEQNGTLDKLRSIAYSNVAEENAKLREALHRIGYEPCDIWMAEKYARGAIEATQPAAGCGSIGVIQPHGSDTVRVVDLDEEQP